jgi:hypothetical protein
MPNANDMSRCLTALEQDSTIIAVVELSLRNWLVAGIVPGLQRHPLKKLQPDPVALLLLLQRWRDEATKAGHTIKRIAVAFEAGRDGFWLARWLRKKSWIVAVTTPLADKISRYRLQPCDWRGLLELMARIRRRVAKELNRRVEIVSCYEAGYDGFWLHRLLEAHGVRNYLTAKVENLANVSKKPFDSRCII